MKFVEKNKFASHAKAVRQQMFWFFTEEKGAQYYRRRVSLTE
jgi:hypothetical protein